VTVCSRLVLPDMVARGRGRIVNVTSRAGVYRWPLLSAYLVSKAAVIKYTENLAQETKRYGIGVFSVHPGILPIGFGEQALTAIEEGDGPHGMMFSTPLNSPRRTTSFDLRASRLPPRELGTAPGVHVAVGGWLPGIVRAMSRPASTAVPSLRHLRGAISATDKFHAALLDDMAALGLRQRREVAAILRTVAETFAKVPDGRDTATRSGCWPTSSTPADGR
jgi:hypothetical protein